MRILAIAFSLLVLVTSCKEDLCKDTVCLNGGTCLDGLGTCECQPGFEGDSCQVFTFERYLGIFEADYGSCVNTPPEHRVGIAQESGANKLRITNLGDYACPSGVLAVLADVSGTTLTMPEQQIDCGDIVYTFSGTGQLDGEFLTIDFKVVYDADGFVRTDNCTATLQKG
ncbi:MAG: calcium-binding EGF-like domain-containing protein [Bacteroidia bacterium]|nr:calcium-binding EGF-like domain-containing protein [Bacteroidia bacterium]